MEPVKSSTQSGPSGRRRARATRSQITKAASELFAERGYVGTTMADIAAAAGVAVQTVYFVFHTKAEVLDSAYGLAVMGEDDPAVPQDQAWYRKALAEPDISIAVQLVVDGLSDILRRVAPLDFAMDRGSRRSRGVRLPRQKRGDAGGRLPRAGGVSQPKAPPARERHERAGHRLDAVPRQPRSVSSTRARARLDACGMGRLDERRLGPAAIRRARPAIRPSGRRSRVRLD